MKLSLCSALLIVGVTATACGSSDAASSSPAAAAPEAPSAAPATAADDLWIDEIDVYQGVKVTVVKDGALRARLNAPIIAGRPALVRVAVKPYAWTGPYIHGELRVKRSGKEDLVLTDGGKRAIPELDDELLDETLNFSIAAEDMTPDATFSFKASLADVALDGTDVVAFPADGGAAPFNAKTASQTLKVKFVPVAYEADAGVSLTPDLADLSSLKDTLYKMYPVANVDVTVREPLKWSTPVEADGPGWDTLLTGIMQLRRADKAEDDVYYVGVFTPKADLGQFCSKGGCILGVAPQTDERDINLRVALVLGYKSRGAGSTLAQELAHAMGRKHAPCGSPQAIDAKFPYADGGIGVWGYDVLKKALINPGDRYRDFMSYCGPTWVSDYTFKGLYERMEIVSQQQQALPGTGAQATGAGAGAARTEVMQSFSVSTDGTIHEGPALDMIPGESSDDIAVSYEGANGRVFSTTRGRVRVISGTGTRLVIAPVAPIGATHARVGALGLTPLHARVLAH